MKLEQKYALYKNEFILTDENLIIKAKTQDEKEERTINLELIGHDKIYKSHSKGIYNIVSILLILFIIFSTIVFFKDFDKNFPSNLPIIIGIILFFGTLSTLMLILPKKEEVFLVNGQIPIRLFSNSPSEEEVEKFINQIIINSKNLLKKKYGKIDTDLPEETQFNQFNFLRMKNIISEEEYDKLKKQYKQEKLIGGQ